MTATAPRLPRSAILPAVDLPTLFTILFAALALTGCAAGQRPMEYPVVVADVETAPVPDAGDAADDPAVWARAAQDGGALVLGSNKLRALHVYDLDGRETQSIESGRLNNVDLRPLPDGDAVAVASNRTTGSIDVFLLDAATGSARPLPGSAVATGLDEIYGICLGAADGERFHVFVNDKDGRYQQWMLSRTGPAAFSARLAREFRLAGQPEGCVVDEAAGHVYVGEEPRGIWRGTLDPADAWAPQLVDSVDGPALVADVEGLTIYSPAAGPRYLLASSQGDNSYAVYCLGDEVRYLVSFRVADNEDAGIDGTEETDGIDATAADLGPRFPRGIFVAQDGRNEGADSQNFKIVDWRRIERVIPEASCP